ncbi:MAG: Uma2 family endonuclease [Thiothrix sp.]|nr:MAG: Uma2 family endonuclease [Thiothrix sp.]
MSLVLKDEKRHTYGEYLSWSDDERYELIDGIAYAMGAAPVRMHQRLLGEMFRQIADALDDSDCEVDIAPFDVRLPERNEVDEEIINVVQPDLIVVCDRDKLDERGCRGAPDWVIEVLSPSTAGHDQILKLALYERHGVREYWLAHPADRIVTIYHLENGQFGRPTVHEMKASLSALCCDVEIAWDRVIARLD